MQKYFLMPHLLAGFHRSPCYAYYSLSRWFFVRLCNPQVTNEFAALHLFHPSPTSARLSSRIWFWCGAVSQWHTLWGMWMEPLLNSQVFESGRLVIAFKAGRKKKINNPEIEMPAYHLGLEFKGTGQAEWWLCYRRLCKYVLFWHRQRKNFFLSIKRLMYFIYFIFYLCAIKTHSKY